MWEKPVLTAEAMKRTVNGLEELSKIMKSYNVTKNIVVATSAVRDSINKQEFVEMVKHRTQLDVKVISGREEAELSYRGVAWGVGAEKKPIVVDIGGGSTELITEAGDRIEPYSVDVGAVRLTGKPVQREELLRLLKPALNQLLKHSPPNLIGVGGTVTTLVAIEKQLVPYNSKKVHGYDLGLNSVKEIWGRLKEIPVEKRKEVPGLMADRADIIVAGIEILIVIMDYMGATKIKVSEADILYGVIYNLRYNSFKT